MATDALCAQRRNRRSDSAALSLALRLWIARVWQTWLARKNLGQGVCRLLEVEPEGAAFGERASAIGEADRRDGTLGCLALRPARGTNISAPSTRAPAIGRPTSTVTHVGNGSPSLLGGKTTSVW